MTDSDWTLSFLSSVCGTFTTLSGEHPTRFYAWAAEDVAEYWLFFREASDSARCQITINSFRAPEPQFYSIIGYCVYHDIKFEIDESLPENVLDLEEESDVQENNTRPH